MPITITISEQEETDFNDFLQSKIRDFNNLNSPHHRAVREPGATLPLHLFLKDEGGEIIGGLSGITYWGWLYIDHLFVPVEMRGRDLGSKLLGMAEDIASKRGCRHCYLTTFEFQAKTFYEKHGYTVAGRLDDYPPGVAYFWMKKELSQP